MRTTRFWELVETLGGVADDDTCERLDAELRESGEGGEFAGLVDEHVDRLLATCPVPEFFRGSDLGEWMAAAIVAAGRETYEGLLSGGAEIDPEQWDWEDAEALLTAGAEEDREDREPEDHGEPVPPLAVTVQWLAPSADRMDLPHDHDPLGLLDFGSDDPQWGRTPMHDPDWAEARRRLEEDDEVLAARAEVAVGLHLTVRAGVEPAVRRFVGPGGPETVLVLPTTAFPATGSRVEAYVAAVRRLLDEGRG